MSRLFNFIQIASLKCNDDGFKIDSFSKYIYISVSRLMAKQVGRSRRSFTISSKSCSSSTCYTGNFKESFYLNMLVFSGMGYYVNCTTVGVSKLKSQTVLNV